MTGQERDPVDALAERVKLGLDFSPHVPVGVDCVRCQADNALDALATRLEAAEAALRRIANRYCLHSKGDVWAESACLHKPSAQWCSICIARAALRAEDAPDE